MKKFSFLLIAFFSTSLLFADSNEDAIKAIDFKLAKLRQQLKEIDLKESNEDTESQAYMLLDWQRFEKETQDTERADAKGVEIRKRIEFLEKQKAELIKSSK